MDLQKNAEHSVIYYKYYIYTYFDTIYQKGLLRMF